MMRSALLMLSLAAVSAVPVHATDVAQSIQDELPQVVA